MNRPQFVICFAQSIPEGPLKEVVLLNNFALPHGEVPGPDSFVPSVAHAVLLEQTGINASLPDCEVIGSLQLEGEWPQIVVRCPFHRTKQMPGFTPLTTLMATPECPLHVKVLVALCRSGVVDFAMYVADGKIEVTSRV